MNPENDTTAANPELTVLASPEASQPAMQPSGQPLPAAPPDTEHRGNGKIARLPKVLRDQVNRMLDDGFTSKAIIQKLNESTDPPLPYPILEMNITRWRDKGYLAYLRHQEWRDDLQALRESAADVTELNEDGHKFQETLVQLGLTEIFRALKDPQTKTDPLNHIRLFNALARLNREALGLRKYNDLRAKEAASQFKTAAGVPTPEEARDIMFHAFEQGMGVKAAPGPIGPDLNIYMAEAKAQRHAAEPATFNLQPSTAAMPAAVGPLPPAGALVSSIENPASSIQNPPPTPAPLPLTGSPTHPPATPRIQHPASPIPELATFNLQLATATPQFAARRKASKSPAVPADRCHECRVLLPPLLSSGERPTTHCNKCGTALRPPGSLIEFCPKCRRALPELNANGTRPTPYCPHCNKPLPPPPQPAPVADAIAEPPNIAA